MNRPDGFRPVSFAVSLRFRWGNETSNETSTVGAKTERNRYFPVSRYKYYNPANGTAAVSFINRTNVGGFVRFRLTVFLVSFDFF